MGPKDLADKIPVSKSAVTHWTNGTNEASGKRLLALAAALSCNAAWLATGKGPTGFEENLVHEAQSAYGEGTSRSAADAVREMLARSGRSLSDEKMGRIIEAIDSPDESPARSNVVTGGFTRNVRVAEGDILIPQYDVRAAMGAGQLPAEYTEFVRNVIVTAPQLERLGLDYTSPANLSVISGWGQSMAPTIQDKDPVIVDRGITEFVGDGIYVITWDGMLYIKRLQRADADHYELISDNSKHKDRIVKADEVMVHAKVLLVWNGHKL